MDFLRYTTLLQENGAITASQAREIRRDIKVIAEQEWVEQMRLEDSALDRHDP